MEDALELGHVEVAEVLKKAGAVEHRLQQPKDDLHKDAAPYANEDEDY